MHNCMPYDPIQGQGHECLKATQEESTQSRTGQFLEFEFILIFAILEVWLVQH